jgi:exoribonuclease II
MFLEGQIIEFLDADELRPGFVRKQERDRLQVIDPRGRHVSVNGDRVAIVHCAARESEFPSIAKGILEKVRSRQSEVDVELLWQTLGPHGREFLPIELSELFFSESTPEAASAVFHALNADTLFFKRNGLRFAPRSAEQVAAEQTRRVRQREREETRDRLSTAVHRLLKGKGEIPEDMEPVIDRIQGWMRHRNGDDVGAILEQVTGASHARDAAYEILLRAGRIDPLADRFLTIAGVAETFPRATLEAAGALAAASHTTTRLDLRDLPAVTIDDEDTVEVDDAVTIREENGEYVVGIHIADVSAFVVKGDVLDTEARHRTSTVYLPTVAARMLPERLSTDLASLREGFDRPAFTAEVRFDSAFNRISPVGHGLLLSTIHVGRRLTYEAADSLIANGDPTLTPLHQIALRLQQERAARGAITFRRPELKIRVRRDESGQTIKIMKVDPNSPSRILVSEMMVLLNGLAADFAAANSLPVIFRTQEARDSVVAGPAVPSASIDAIPLHEALAFEKVRRTFKRSRLSLTPGLHSGLGLSAYTQVSSPIRRYADLVTQRQFTALLHGRPVPHAREELLEVLAAAETSELEIRALEERSTSYWLLQHLAREKMGSVLTAIVLDRKGAIELEDYYLRGKLPDPGTAEPGSSVQVMIDHIDPARSEVRFKRA